MEFSDVISVIAGYSAKNGVEYELFLFNASILKMEAENSAISSYTEAVSSGFSLRLKDKNRVSFSYCSGLEEEKVTDAFHRALDLVKVMEENNDIVFSDRTVTPKMLEVDENSLGIYSNKFFLIGSELKKKSLFEMEEAAYSFDKRIFKVDKPSYSEVLLSKRLLNSNGVDLSSKKTHYEIFLSAASKNNGESQSGFDFDNVADFSSLKFKKVAMNAAKKATDLLGARIIKSGKYKVLFDNITSSEILSILTQSFYSSNVYKKKSLVSNKVGKKIFSDKIGIIDDGLLYGGYGTDAYDAEGVKTGKKVLCSKGIINSFLYDNEYADKFKSRSTGNSVRHSHTLPPEVGATNFFIENGKADLFDLFKQAADGLYITELMGIHMAKPYTGEFSLGASGFYLKNGEIVFPVKGIILSGNLVDLFNNVIEIGNDIRFLGNIGSPSILSENIQVSGE